MSAIGIDVAALRQATPGSVERLKGWPWPADNGDGGHNRHLMRIEVSTSSSAGLLGRAPGLIPEWQVGAVVRAVAVRDAASGQLWLAIGRTRVPARIASGDPAGPAEGEALNLRVLRNSPVIAFEALEPEPATASDVASDSLRRMLPRQASPTGLLANAAWHAGRGDTDASLPPQVGRALAALWQGLPTTGELASASGLEKAIRHSGLFLEAQLGGNPATVLLQEAPSRDLKALLLSLRTAMTGQAASTPAGVATHAHAQSPLPLLRGSLLPLQETAPSLASIAGPGEQADELFRQTDGALARLTSTQLVNAAAQGLAYLVEIPVRHDNDARMLRFRFERQQDRPSGQSGGWSVEAALTLRQGEAVHARVTFQGGRIAVQLRSDSAAVVDRLKLSREALAGTLRNAGLEVEQVVCLHGLPAADPGQSRAQLVDTRA